jgi:hypothetical protein
MVNGKHYFIDFYPVKATMVLRLIGAALDQRSTVQTKVGPQFVTKEGITAAWVNRRITTLKYLLCLNYYACRSYEQMHLYPVFPNLKEKKVIVVNPSKYVNLFFAGGPPTLEETLSVADEELTPEFFFLFEAFVGLVANPLEFVYRNRMALEDSSEMNFWIDKVFGVLQMGCFPAGVPIPRLFVQPHPSRSPPRECKSPPVELRLPLGAAFTHCFADVGENGVVVHIVSDNVYSRFTCRGTDLSQISVETKQCPKGASALLMKHTLVFVSAATVQFPSQTIDNPSKSSEFLDCDGPWLVCGKEDGYFYGLGPAEKPVSFNVLPHYPSVVRVSATRNLVCVGTTSHNVLVFELDTGKIFEILELGNANAYQLAITSEFGFIIAFCKGAIVAFTENGTEMYRKEFPSEAAVVHTARTFDGRDYIFIGTAQNEIAFFEAFRGDVVVVVKTVSRPAAVVYSVDLVGLCYVTEDAVLHFQPFRL